MFKNKTPEPGTESNLESTFKTPVERRVFLKYAGATAAVTSLLLAGCSDDDDVITSPTDTRINLGSGDTGILNYAYALEQLEAAFYTQVVASTAFATTFPDAKERATLTEIRDHEIAHREFFKAALGANAIPGLTPNFSAINFNDRTTVLATAKTFEDLGVSAYNGAGKLLSDAGNLLLAGKIVSVEARHAAEIRDIISNGSFADSTAVDSNGLDVVRTPAEVLALAGGFITEKLNADNLPTT
jgi:hypothetical protein